MVISLEKPDAIYQHINTELEKVVQSIKSMSQDAAISEEKNTAQLTLAECQHQLKLNLEELHRNSEWSRFTIAFYGETGAGKSTLIETLRILLNEPSKARTRQQYKQVQQQLQASESQLQTLATQVQDTRELLERFDQQLQATRQRYKAPAQMAAEAVNAAQVRHQEEMRQLQEQWHATKMVYDRASAAVQKLEDFIAHYQKTASLWKRLKDMFRPLPEKQELQKVQTRKNVAREIHATATANLQTQQQRQQQEHAALAKQLADVKVACETACAELVEEDRRMRHKLKQIELEQSALQHQHAQLGQQLLAHVDGGIIGDGRPDNTLLTQQYDFTLNGHDFSLLDVPGIEGNENKTVDIPSGGKTTVYEQITSAVQRAHAVFYVTNKPSPPQTGDTLTKGTLEKIREHLSSQTEVWSIFNKKITNAKQSLKNKELLSKDEQTSLQGLNEKMHEHLGKNYREAIALAALPAFLVSTDHFAPDSIFISRRKKILDDFTAQELLVSSKVQDFVDFLGSSLVADSRARIKKSNFNKAHAALMHTMSKLQGISDNFSKLHTDLTKNKSDANDQLRSSFQSLKVRLQATGSQLISDFESNVRNRVYSRIEDDISNDDFKSALSYHLEKEQQKLLEAFPKALSKDVERFQNDVKDVVSKFTEHAKELSSIYEQINKTQLDTRINIDINIDNGIKVGSLLMSLAGGVAAVLGTGGWILAIGLAGLLFSFAKSVWGFFDSDFKKSEQRKSTNQNLAKIVDELNQSLEESLKKVLPDVQNKLTQVEKAIDAPVQETARMVQLLDYSTQELTSTSKKIISLGGL